MHSPYLQDWNVIDQYRNLLPVISGFEMTLQRALIERNLALQQW